MTDQFQTSTEPPGPPSPPLVPGHLGAPSEEVCRDMAIVLAFAEAAGDE